MIYGYARVSVDGLSVDTPMRALRAVGARQGFGETAGRIKADHAPFRRELYLIQPADEI